MYLVRANVQVLWICFSTISTRFWVSFCLLAGNISPFTLAPLDWTSARLAAPTLISLLSVLQSCVSPCHNRLHLIRTARGVFEVQGGSWVGGFRRNDCSSSEVIEALKYWDRRIFADWSERDLGGLGSSIPISRRVIFRADHQSTPFFRSTIKSDTRITLIFCN